MVKSFIEGLEIVLDDRAYLPNYTIRFRMITKKLAGIAKHDYMVTPKTYNNSNKAHYLSFMHELKRAVKSKRPYNPISYYIQQQRSKGFKLMNHLNFGSMTDAEQLELEL